MRTYILTGAPTTGQTPLTSKVLQPWAAQTLDERGIECYCLDAPTYIPTGRPKPYIFPSGVITVDQFVNRDR